MAYGSGVPPPYFCWYCLKNFLPSGPKAFGSSVAIVHLNRGAASGGTPFFGSADALRQSPSLSYSFVFGCACATAFRPWLAFCSISPVERKQSAFTFAASER